MLKKILLTLFITFGICLSSLADEIKNIPYKNIKAGEKITFSQNGWTKANKNSPEYYTKKVSDGSGSYSEFYQNNDETLFSTGCHYEFIYNGKLIGYSNSELKFYQFYFNNDGNLCSEELSLEEISELFKDFYIIKISDFSQATNSIKIKKNRADKKIILYNDTNNDFYHYNFTSNNSQFSTYQLKGFLDIKQKGMIQFSHFDDKQTPWYVILVR